MNSKIFVLSLFLLSWAKSQAQLNESDTVKFQLRTGVSGNWQQGNVNLLAIRSRLEFSFSPAKKWVVKSQNSSLYQEFSSKKADNDIFSRNYLYYQPQKKIYPFAIAYISSNFRRKIATRFFTGAGITYQLLNKPNQVIKFSATAVYETNSFKETTYNYSENNGSKKINLWRGTLFTTGWTYLFKHRLRIYYDAFWQPAFSNKNNYRTQVDIGADLPLWKGLNFTTLYTSAYENVVISNIKQADKIITFGFSYNFKTKKN
jgi:Protein of unknown function, DUF481